MYAYVDESGHTGQNLFDPAQPTLMYGVLSSRLNLDVVAETRLAQLRRSLGVPRLHASELGNARLPSILPALRAMQREYDLRFDLYRVEKADHAVISFFDQVFDQGMNPAVPWHWYWTPLRFPLLLHLASLFDEELAKQAWATRLEVNNAVANAQLTKICEMLISQAGSLRDARIKVLLEDGLAWARDHPYEIRYNAQSAQERIVIAPNTVGFQHVILGIASRVRKVKPRSLQVIVDQQTQFNRAQQTVAGWYQTAKASVSSIGLGPGMPKMEVGGVPDAPLVFKSSANSAGLELVDIYLWTFKRHFEAKELAPELFQVIESQVHRGRTDQISLRAIDKRWSEWFRNLPEPSADQMEGGRKLLRLEAERRANLVANYPHEDT